MKKQIICTALAVLFVTCIKAQTFGEIHGKVLDENGKAAIGAVVIASNTADEIGIATDELGKFRLKPLKPGEYTVITILSGMHSDTLTGVIVTHDQITFVDDVYLYNQATLLNEQRITAYRIPLIRIDGDHIQTITAEELKNMSSANGGKISSIVLSMTSDIKPAEDGGGLSVRGSRSGGVLYFVDGVKVRGDEVSVPSSGISSVSVYSGGIPAKYGDTTGGVVVVETKSYLEDFYRKMNQ